MVSNVLMHEHTLDSMLRMFCLCKADEQPLLITQSAC